jgi:DNA modification methylase
MIKIKNGCALEWLKAQPDYSADIIYCDPPYALGSEIIIRPDGKPDYKKAVDFMAKWEMPDGSFWESFYKESMRVLKHGGHLLMFGIDRQLFLFGYYSNLAGFETKQSLYWYFISNFPKASDLSKMIDKNAGAEREVVGKREPLGREGRTTRNASGKNMCFNVDGGKEKLEGGAFDVTEPATDLAKKYDGFKYSIAPLKQVVETIMVFQKPYKTGSCLHDVLAMENGDETVTCGALDIDGNRVAIDKNDPNQRPNGSTKLKDGGKTSMFKIGGRNDKIGGNTLDMENGRFPSQAFVSPETAEILDKQSIKAGIHNAGSKTDNFSKSGKSKHSMFKNFNKDVIDSGMRYGNEENYGASKILHKCDFETADLFVYEPKVSSSERNAGCENLEKTKIAGCYGNGIGETPKINGERPTATGNFHPTLKPIALNYKIGKLFKTPNPQTALVPFSGAGSEIIGLFRAGFETIKGCELNPEFVEISKARVIHHCRDLFNPIEIKDLDN